MALFHVPGVVAAAQGAGIMAGFNADESLTERLKSFRTKFVRPKNQELMEEVLAVLEGRLMIDAKGMLRLPCGHEKGVYKPCMKCAQCGQDVPQHWPIGPEKAAEWAALLIMKEIHWSSTPQGVEYWQQVYKNLRSLAGSPE